MNGDDLTILIPVLRRPWRIAHVYESARAATPDAQILFIASPDDGAELGALDAFGVEYIVTTWPGGDRGDYARKINLGYLHSSRPVLFTGADDLDFHPDWYERARPLLEVPDEVVQVMPAGGVLIGPGKIPQIGVVGTMDTCNARTMDMWNGEPRVPTHSTHSLVARWYADQGGSPDRDHMIYFTEYWHEYCDDELIGTAMARGAYAHSDAVVEHLHPNRDAGDHPNPNDVPVPLDEVYLLGRERSRLSRRIFFARRRLWQGPPVAHRRGHDLTGR